MYLLKKIIYNIKIKKWNKKNKELNKLKCNKWGICNSCISQIWAKPKEPMNKKNINPMGWNIPENNKYLNT